VSDAGGATRTGTVFLDVENDSFLSGDRYYTNGIRLGWRSAARPLDNKRAVFYSISLANNMYTGADITLTPQQIPLNDRPYAGWTHLDLTREVISDNDESSRWDFSLGCLGPCSGTESLQKWWHDQIVGAPEPQGWSTQIGDEGTAQLFYRRRFATRMKCDTAAGCSSEAVRAWDVAPHITASVGNVFVTAGIGATARLGLYKMRGYANGLGVGEGIPKAPMVASYRGRVSSLPQVSDAEPEVFMFARVEARAVIFNATVEGRMIGGPDPSSVDAQRVVLDTEVGAAISLKRATALVSYAARSTEVDRQPSDFFRHRWLQIRLTTRL
jgi:lipid A 3-O-deacylase